MKKDKSKLPPLISGSLNAEVASFIGELDAAVETHMSWARRVLRCAVLHTSPGRDVLAENAHELCRFGRWFVSNEARFIEIDAKKSQKIETVHKLMHDAIRSICTNILTRQPGRKTDLDAFESTQSELIALLSDFKTLMLSRVTRIDPLTGLPLRYTIEDDFNRIRKICKRNKTLPYLAMIDIDHFKRINDKYGHPIGDLALRYLADTVKSTLRPDDILYRYGGEEFLLLMQCQNEAEANIAALRIINSIRGQPIPIPDGTPLTMTITLGITLVGTDDTLDSVIKRADHALYEGKGAGRNRFILTKPDSFTS